MPKLLRLTVLLLLLSIPLKTRPLLASADLILIYGADLDGEFEPCGCPGTPRGGFVNRLTLLQEIRREGAPMVLVETGNVLTQGALTTAEAKMPDARRLDLIGRLLRRSGVQALALGARDLWTLGEDTLRTWSRRHHLPLLSANLEDQDGSLPFPPAMTLEAAGKRLGVIGLTEPIGAVARRAGLRFRSLDAAIASARQSLPAKADVLIVLSDLSAEDNMRLAQSHPEIDFILAAKRTKAGTRGMNQRRAPWILPLGGEGQELGRIDMAFVGDQGETLRSTAWEKRLAAKAATRASLKALRELIAAQEGRFDEERFSREGAFLLRRLAALEAVPPPPPQGRLIFAFQGVTIRDDLEDDKKAQAMINAYQRSQASRSRGAAPDAPSPAKPPRPLVN